MRASIIMSMLLARPIATELTGDRELLEHSQFLDPKRTTADDHKILRIPKWGLLPLTLQCEDRLEHFFEGRGHGQDLRRSCCAGSRERYAGVPLASFTLTRLLCVASPRRDCGSRHYLRGGRGSIPEIILKTLITSLSRGSAATSFCCSSPISGVG